MHSLSGPAWWLETPTGSVWESMSGDEFPDAVFPGLPWFLDDLRPQGFLGRAFARRHGQALEAGFDPITWSERAVVESLLRFGSDLPGGFVLGQEALANALLPLNEEPIPAESREAAYPRLAEEALAGGILRSSAGGEQPKFTATISKLGGPAAAPRPGLRHASDGIPPGSGKPDTGLERRNARRVPCGDALRTRKQPGKAFLGHDFASGAYLGIVPENRHRPC